MKTTFPSIMYDVTLILLKEIQPTTSGARILLQTFELSATDL
jgi:hypothetical protein